VVVVEHEGRGIGIHAAVFTVARGTSIHTVRESEASAAFNTGRQGGTAARLLASGTGAIAGEHRTHRRRSCRTTASGHPARASSPCPTATPDAARTGDTTGPRAGCARDGTIRIATADEAVEEGDSCRVAGHAAVVARACGTIGEATREPQTRCVVLAGDEGCAAALIQASDARSVRGRGRTQRISIDPRAAGVRSSGAAPATGATRAGSAPGNDGAVPTSTRTTSAENAPPTSARPSQAEDATLASARAARARESTGTEGSTWDSACATRASEPTRIPGSEVDVSWPVRSDSASLPTDRAAGFWISIEARGARAEIDDLVDGRVTPER
jgi:hypothetical protein